MKEKVMRLEWARVNEDDDMSEGKGGQTSMQGCNV